MINRDVAATCSNCRFSLPAKKPDGTIDFRNRFCRRNPPTPLIIPGQNGPILQSLWPTLSVNDYCFSHEANGAEPLLPGEVKPEKTNA